MTAPNSATTLGCLRRKIVRGIIPHFNLSMVDLFSLAALAVTRLQAVFGSFLPRRLKNSLLDGKRLIELPKKTVDLVKLEFSQEEREIYTMVSLNPYRS